MKPPRVAAVAAVLFGLATTFQLLAQTSPSGRAVGPVLAAVRIDVFSDYQCPHCRVLHEGTLKRVKEQYAQTGKIRLVHHDFPLPGHAFARRAAQLVNAADKIGKYDVVADAIFARQDSWSANGNLDLAIDAVLTPDERKRVRELANDPAILAEIDRDVALGTRMNVTSTPTMIVSKAGKTTPVVGSVTYAVFARFLDSLLTP